MEGKIGGDALLSDRGLAYAKALPDLITDNIGDAPLTVRHILLSPSFVLTIRASLIVHKGLDVDATTNNPDWRESAIY